MEMVAGLALSAAASYGAQRLATMGSANPMKAIKAAQARQQAALDTQTRNTQAKESALLRLFSGGQGATLSSAPLASTLGG